MNGRQIVGLLRPLSNMRYGYTYAQNHTMIWSMLLDADVHYGSGGWTGTDIYFYTRADYGGESGYNYFGGLTEGFYKILKSFVEHEANYYSLDFPMLDIGKDIRKRLDNPSCYKEFTLEFADKVSEKCSKVITVLPEEFAEERITIGDSHSLSMTPAYSPVKKIIGKTLYSTLKNKDLFKYAEQTKAKTISFMFGSIDIRHHIFRQDNPMKSLQELIDNYVKDCIEINHKYNKNIEICSPTPIEWEGRKLPKSGNFKGTRFAGTREERLCAVLTFINSVKEQIKDYTGISLVQYPEEWYKMDGKLYADKIMERPSNTHVSLKYSRLNNFGYSKEFDDW